MTISYTPAEAGGWLAVVSSPRALLVADPPGDEFVDEALARAAGADGMESLLDLLTRRGYAATPSFVLLEGDGAGVRVIVRGEATVTGAGERITGADVATWVERRLLGSGVRVELAAARASRGPLPVERGVVIAATLAYGADTAEGSGASEGADDAIDEATVVVPNRRKEASAAAEPSPAEPTPVAAPPAATEPTTEPSREPSGDEGSTSYDYLFGDTMYRSVRDAAVHADGPAEEDGPDAAEAQPAVALGSEGDHDGQTVLATDVSAERAARKRRPKRADTAPADTAPADVPPEAAPPVAELAVVLPGGEREPLAHPLLIGRAPSVANVPAGQMPRLVTVGNGDQDISRTHVRLAVEGGTAVVTDMHSRNGTSVILPGQAPQRLRAGEPTPVIAGAVIDLGGGVELRVEEQST